MRDDESSSIRLQAEKNIWTESRLIYFCKRWGETGAEKQARPREQMPEESTPAYILDGIHDASFARAAALIAARIRW
jgi:hypothetical protein